MLTAARASHTPGPQEGIDHLFLLPERVLTMDSASLHRDLAGLDFSVHLLQDGPRGNVWLCKMKQILVSLSNGRKCRAENRISAINPAINEGVGYITTTEDDECRRDRSRTALIRMEWNFVIEAGCSGWLDMKQFGITNQLTGVLRNLAVKPRLGEHIYCEGNARYTRQTLEKPL
ncbi:hypothetical protein J6590_008358 [Homalodisca vitripennis]|nr:hypothetical protein J6590_008358 [Homalodisca vitripennis]